MTSRFPFSSPRSRSIRSLSLLLLGLLVSGCAARSESRFSKRLIKQGTPPVEMGEKVPPPPKASLAEYAGKLRALAVGPPRRAVKGLVATLENTDPLLSNALLGLQIAPTPLAHRRVAEHYRRLGILDSAYDHFAAAAVLDSTDAAAYEGLARVWRDWGTPQLGLADASRAVYYAPSWAVAHNTLGTLLAALGRRPEARREYQRALALDPTAAYALNNVCYLSFLEGNPTTAIEECQAALAIDPGLTAARNNLALANAAAGRTEEAKREFLTAGDAATASYNMGIVQLAEKDYAAALKAFQAAHDARPTWAAAFERARQARRLDSPARNSTAE